MWITDITLPVVCCCFIVLTLGNAGPITQKIFYARKGSTIDLPCHAETSSDALRWIAEHGDEDLDSRSTTAVDPDDSTLTFQNIRNVKESDAGEFVCSDGEKSSKLQLIVIDPSAPKLKFTRVKGDDKVEVIWGPPLNNLDAVTRYRIYVTDVRKREEVYFEENATSNSGRFILKDLSPNTEYRIQVVAEYTEGAVGLNKTVEGPRSQALSVRTPKFEPKPDQLEVKEVKARPWHNNSIIVSWTPVPGRGVDGYKVFYEVQSKRPSPPGSVTVYEGGAGGVWQVTLEGLKTKMKYNIAVAPVIGGGSEAKVGRKSKPIVYTHDGFTPEMSIHAIPLSSDSVLVAVSTVGPAKVEELRVVHTDESAIEWVRVEQFKKEQRYGVVTGLRPQTRYFFMAKARVSGKARQTITDVTTPPTALVSPSDLNVTAKSDSSVLITWNYNHITKPVGFILDVNKRTDDNVFNPERQQVVLKQNEALLKNLFPNQKYQVRVVPFNIEDKGPCGEPVNFHLVSSDLQITTPVIRWVAPYFQSIHQEIIKIESGQVVELTCLALGTPKPLVQWFKDGRPMGLPTDGINKFTVSNLTYSSLFTCKAKNSVGEVAKHTRVEVTPPVVQGVPPRFTSLLPPKLDVTRGGDLRQSCSAVGDPKPTISWYRNDIQQGNLRRGPDSVEYTEKRLSKPFTLKCVATNIHGAKEQVMEVNIKDPLQPPVPVGEISQYIERTEGEDVLINCSFAGIPTPQVTWFNGTKKMTIPQLSQSTLAIPSVIQSSVFTCRGENEAGFVDHRVILAVKPRPTPPTTTTTTTQIPETTTQIPETTTLIPEITTLPPSGYRLYLRQRVISPKDVDVRWIVNKGDTFNIRHFQYTVFDEKYKKIEQSLLGPNRRKLSLKNLNPGERYTFNLKTFNYDFTLLDDTSLDVMLPYNITQRPNIPELEIEVFEITDEYARLAIHEYGIRPKDYRIQVKEDDAKPGSLPFIDRTIDDNLNTTLFNQLTPERGYQVIVEARNRDSVPIKTVRAAFTTPSRGGAGRPVMESSLHAEVTPATEEPVVTTAELPEPLTITPTTAPTFTIPTTTTTSTTPNPRKYVIALSHRSKPRAEELKWVVHQGDLKAISSFDIVLTDEATKRNTTRRVPPSGRIWSFPVSDTTSGRYTFYLLTNVGGQVVDTSSLEFLASPNTVTPGSGKPELKFEVNEIRDKAARLHFYSSGITPYTYQLQVLDTDAAPGTPPAFNQTFSRLLPAMKTIETLLPNRLYRVILEAKDLRRNPILNATAEFRTPPRGGYGLPVVGWSSNGKEVSTTTATTTEATTATTTKATTATTTEATTATTTEATTATTTEATPTTTTVEETTVEETTTEDTTVEETPVEDTTTEDPTMEDTTVEDTTTEDTTVEDTTPEFPSSEVTIPELTAKTTIEATTDQTTSATTAPTTTSTTIPTTTETELPEDLTYVMTSRAVMKQPNIPVIKWQIDRGNIDNIKSFEIYVKGANGRYIYNGTLGGNQRYVSFSTFPKGNFRVTLKAIGPEGVLAENDVIIPTPMDETKDNVNPRLDFGATELRSNSVNLLWDTSNIKANDISGYRVRMFDEGPDGYEVVTKVVDRATGSLRLLELHPKTTYYAVLDVIGNDNRTLMSSALTFSTPPRNGYGEDVTGTMLDTPNIDEVGEPEMKMFIKANATSGSHRVSWNLKNLDDSSVKSFNLLVRSGDRFHRVFELDGNVKNFIVECLKEGRDYNFELVAVSDKGDTISRVVTPYSPGTSSDPLVVSSLDAPQTPDEQIYDRSRGHTSPALVMSMASEQPNGHRLSWGLDHNNYLVLDKYRLTVTKDGSSDVIGRYDFTEDVNSFILDNILPGSSYELDLKAFFKQSAYVLNGLMVYTPGLSSEPLKETKCGEEIPDNWIPELENKAPPPQMELSVVSDEPSGHRLSWQLTNADEALVDQYLLKVRKNGADGDVITSVELTKDEKSYPLPNLLLGSTYHLTVDSQLDGYWLLLSGQNYTPGVSPDPFVVTAREPIRADVQLEIRSEPDSTHKVSWNLRNVNKELIDKYILTVSNFGEQNDVIAREEFDKNVEQHIANNLLPGSSYRVELQALSSAFSDAMSAVTVYTPGVSSDPLLITAQEPLDPKIQISVQSEDESSQRVSWKLLDVPYQLVKNYILTVREDGADGDVITYKELNCDVSSHVLNNVASRSKYHVSLEAKLIPQCSLLEAGTDFTPGVSLDPVIVTGQGVKLPDMWEPEANDKEPKLPEMHLSIKARGSTGHRVSWYLKNINSSLVDKYKLTIRMNRDDGDIVKSMELANDVDFHVTPIFQLGSTYHVEVEALAAAGNAIVTAYTEYTPGKSADPLVVIAQGEPLLSPFDTETDDEEGDDDSPVLDTEVSAVGPTSALLKWNVTGFSPSQLLGSVDIKIFVQGQNVLQSTALLSDRKFTVNGMLKGLQCLINVTALDDAKQEVVFTAFNYQFPGHDVSVEPLRVSSNPDRLSDSSEGRRKTYKNDTYVITRAKPSGGDLDLEWLVVSTGRPKKSTLVRYTPITDGKEGDAIIRVIPPGVTATTLSSIGFSKRYGFQVGTAVPWSGKVRWSDTVYRTRFN